MFLTYWFFFYQGFLSRTLTTHRIAGEGRGSFFLFFFIPLPLPPTHELSDIYLQLCMWDEYHLKKTKNVFLGHLNINSIKNKFESVWELIKDTFDIFLLSESKLDSSFPDDQFSIPGYRIVRKDRDRNGGGLLLYINEDIPFKITQNSSLPSVYFRNSSDRNKLR